MVAGGGGGGGGERDFLPPVNSSEFLVAQNLAALYNKNNRVLLLQALCVIGSQGNLMFKLHISPRTEHQISSGNLSHDSAFHRSTLLFK